MQRIFFAALFTSFLFFSFFPYVCSSYCTRSDLQPYALATALVICLCGKMHLSRYFYIPWLLFLAFLAKALLKDTSDVWEFKLVFGILSIVIFASIYLYLLRTHRQAVVYFIYASLALWTLAACFQEFFGKDLFSFALFNLRTDQIRGVTSLAPEPSQYGIVMILLVFALSILKPLKSTKVIAITAFVATTILARSSVASGVAFLLLTIFLFNVRYTVPMAGFVFGLFILYQIEGHELLMGHSRILNLLALSLNDPLQVVLRDASANDRIGHIVGSIKAFWDSGGLPRMNENWSQYATNYVQTMDLFANNTYFSKIGVLSTWGGLTFYGGIIGLATFCYFLIFFAIKLQNLVHPARLALGFTIFLLLFPVSLHIPLLGLIVAAAIVTATNTPKHKSPYQSPNR